MKFIRHLLGWALVLSSIAGVLWGSFVLRERMSPPEHEEHEEAAKAAGDEKKEEHEGFHLDEEAQKRLGLATVELKAAEWLPQTTAIGEVLNLTPYFDLQSDLATAEASAVIAKRALERAKTLKAAGDLAEKDFDAAESAAREADIKVTGIRRHLASEWGEVVKTPLTSSTVLARVETTATQAPAGALKVLRAMIGGAEVRASAITAFPAPSADPKTQFPAWIIRLEGCESPPAIGAAVTAMLAAGSEAEKGVLIPADAVVHFNGLAWVFVEEKAGEYERRAITLDHPLPNGWFAADGFDAGDKVVTTGAVHLLAVENKALLGEKE